MVKDPRTVVAFTVRQGKIAEIGILGDPTRLGRLGLAVRAGDGRRRMILGALVPPDMHLATDRGPLLECELYQCQAAPRRR